VILKNNEYEMKFETIKPNDNDIKNIADIILKTIGTKNMAEAIVTNYKGKFDLFMKEFDYPKYIAADTEARKKWDFLPDNIVYINGDELNQRTFRTIIKEINNIILYKAIMWHKGHLNNS
jgi:hypothetical protein